jgi:hypothetical protein
MTAQQREEWQKRCRDFDKASQKPASDLEREQNLIKFNADLAQLKKSWGLQ